MMARWIGAAPRQRGNSEACRLKQPSGKRLQHRLGQDQAVGDDHRGIGAVGTASRLPSGRPQCFRRQDRDAEPPGFARDRARPQLHAAPRRLRRARVDRHDLVSGADNFQKRGHREIGRTHEDEAERQLGLHLALRRFACCFGCLGEFLDDAIALELRDVVDEQHAVGMVDLVLETGPEQSLRA